MTVFRHAITSCPACGHRINVGGTIREDSPEAEEPPKKDDVTVCLYCGTVLTYRADFTLRVMPQDELMSLPRLQRWEIQQIVMRVREMRL
jgi:hypothetical protein